MRKKSVKKKSLRSLYNTHENNSKIKTPLNTENYKYMDSISYNIIKAMTVFKNQEISPLSLNKILFGNLSLFITQKNKNLKKSKTKNISQQFLPTEEYGLYIPTKRIPCLFYNEKNKESEYDNNYRLLLYRKPKIKIPFNREFINCFKPLGRDFIITKVEKKIGLNMQNSGNYNNNSNKVKNDRSKSITLNDSMSFKSNNSFLNSFDNLSLNSGIINDSNSIFSKNKTDVYYNKNQNEKTYPYYQGLIDYIECPFIKNNTNDKTILELLEDIGKIDNDFFFINNTNTSCIDNFNNSIVQEIDDEFLGKKIIVPKNLKESKKNLAFKNPKIKKGKDGSDHLFAFFKYYDKNSKDIISLNSRRSVNLQKKAINNTIIKPFLEKKYINQMNKKYIIFIYKCYKKILRKCSKNKLFSNGTSEKKLFLNNFKRFILLNGICSKSTYTKMIKYQTYNNELSFEKFLQCFDIILNKTDANGIKEKLLFLLSLISQEDDINNNNNNSIYDDKDINNYFDLLSCNLTYVQDFSEELGERFIFRYNTIYIGDNINGGRGYYAIKLKTVLDSFLEQFLIDE